MSILSWLLDLLYPPKCVVCGKLLTVKAPVCPHCLDVLPDFDGAAPSVRFTSGGAVSFFYEGKLRESFLRFKFGGSAYYAQTYGAWMAHTICDKLAGTYDVLTWAPVSRARKRKRGYDQAALLCRALGARLGLEPARAVHACRRRTAAGKRLRRVPGRAARALRGKARPHHRRHCNDRRNTGRMQPHAAAGRRVGRCLRGVCRAEKTRLKDNKAMKLIRDIGIDLGTANVLCYVEGRGIVLREPSVVAVDKNTGKVLQVGAAARNMLGRTPGNIVAVRPLRDGVITDYEMTEKMLEQFLKKINKFTLVKPRVIVSVPSGITEVEERAVIQAAMEAGARRVYLIEEPFAAALGAKLAISGPEGHMVVDIGGGTTDIAVLSLNGIAASSSIKVAGDTFDEAVAAYMRKRYGMLIGLNTAEEVKITIGCVYPRPQELFMLVKGRDAKTGLPNEVTISSAEMLEAFKRPARQIVDEALDVLEHSSPELVADIAQTGIVLTGGGSLLYGFDKLISERTEIACSIADDADSCVANGCGRSLQWISSMQEGTINLARRKLMKEQ